LSRLYRKSETFRASNIVLNEVKKCLVKDSRSDITSDETGYSLNLYQRKLKTDPFDDCRVFILAIDEKPGRFHISCSDSDVLGGSISVEAEG
jgi:hypothetical protein